MGGDAPAFHRSCDFAFARACWLGGGGERDQIAATRCGRHRAPCAFAQSLRAGRPQFHLRKEAKAARRRALAVQWKAKNVDWSKLRLRAEMRCLLEDHLHTVFKEEPAVRNGHFSTWSEFRIEGVDYKTFGQIVAWRVTLFEGDHQLGQLESFLWSGVVTEPIKFNFSSTFSSASSTPTAESSAAADF